MLEDRIKEKIYNLTKDKDNVEIPNKYILDSLTGIQKQNLDLKSKLGFNNTKKIGWLDFWSMFCKKINAYAVEHRGEFTFKCPKCGMLALILRKVSDSDIFEWKMFRGTFIYNKTVMELIDEKKIDYARASKIFGCSPEYMEGLYNKLFLKEKAKEKKNV